MIHAVITIAWCTACILCGFHWAFMLALPAFYLGREHSQAEERWMRARNLNREKSPWWMGLHPSAWTLKSLLDFLLPFLVSMPFIIFS